MNGSYTFSANGTNSSGFFTLVGVLQADGKGAITSGHTFYNSASTGFAGNFSASGTYTVGTDGSTTISLAAELLGPVNLDVVLISPQHGVVVRFDNAATASGRIDQQDASAFSMATLAGTYAFNISGVDSANNPEASVGVFTMDAAGNITGGVQDTNDNGIIQSNIGVVPGPISNMTILPSIGRGVLSYSTSDGGVRDFACFVIDANHLRLVSNSLDRIAGDAFRVSQTGISGSFVFAMKGTSSNGAFAAGGVINTDGAGGILNSSVEDVNNGGAVTLNSGLSGSYSLVGNRATVVLNGGAINLAAYPSTGGVQLLELDSGTIASGVALQQQSGALSNSTLMGSYGASLSGAGAAGTFDAVSRLSADGGGHLAGTFSLNDSGTLNPNLTLNGTYAFGPNGRATGTLVTSAGSMNVVFYAASSSQALFIETDSNRVSQGILSQQ